MEGIYGSPKLRVKVVHDENFHCYLKDDKFIRNNFANMDHYEITNKDGQTGLLKEIYSARC